MIKRRFYKLEHGDKDDPSGSSSSSSDSEVETGATDDSEDDAGEELREDHPEPSSTSSGYESEDSSGNEVGVDSTGSPVDEDDSETGNHGQSLSESPLPSKLQTKIKNRDFETTAEADVVPADALAYVLKCKSVFRCRICPRIVCLNEESLKAHLISKRHIRSEKLLNDGRLKSMLNSDGEVEDQETAAEMHARIVSLAKDNPTKKKKGEQQPRKRFRKKKMQAESDLEDAKRETKSSSKKQRRK
ncbi:uncharacterized protein LOC116206887 isoform X1 [Punica granatum]|uniref:Uncharacterized protein LOC116206887 isoform X1 n=1 Tax=Punica granatum TaxID=22663 RepID=A0A6P8DEC4_PUNGR|nr:uncharacterized protein LOC116206887 isoform X1 [Punica granatum]